MNQRLTHPLLKGVNVIGYFGKCLGLGQSARLIFSALQKQAIPFSLISADSWAQNHPKEHFPIPISNEFPFQVNLFCIDQRQVSTFIEELNWNRLNSCYNIAICFWETNRFPKQARNWWYYLNEIWATTHYVQEHLSIAASIPVYRIPQPVALPSVSKDVNKTTFKLKNSYTFLFFFSFSSVLTRKNPLAIIQAFRKAFPNCQDVQLVIKSQNGHQYPDQLKYMLNEVKTNPRIVWLDQTCDAQECYDLMNVCDCYISLHRSEGFGLTLAEAMLLGKPVIATGYSGNLDFMNEENSFLCSHKIISVGKGCLYPPDGVWADVDIDHAAYWMDYVFHHRAEANTKAQKGKEYILKHHSLEVTGQHIAWRLNKIPTVVHARPKPWKYRRARIKRKVMQMKKIAKHIINFFRT
jgi:glycosyltransferase involved in cell wall biosynthesis